MTESMIIYRNPLEKAFWESGYILPVVGGVITFAVVFLCTITLIESLIRMKKAWYLYIKYRNLITWFAAVVGTVAALKVYSVLMI